MQELEKKPIKKHKISTILQSLYEFLEQNHVDSIFLKCLGVSLYFFHMISYVYYFAYNEVTDSYGQYICYFHYYLNLTNILHYIQSYQFTLFIFSLCFAINLVIIINMINHILIMRFFGQKHKNRKINLFEIIINELSNLFLWHFMFFAIEMFMIGFKTTEETDYLRKKISPDNYSSLKAIGILGILMSCLNGAVLIYFNQDYKFLDKSKMRLNLSIKVILCILIRLILLILYNTVSNSEVISFLMIYCFLFLNFLLYFTNVPFKSKILSIYFISLLCYSFLNILILTLFRINVLITDHDLFPINAILLIFCLKIGEKIYYQFYYFYLFYENNNRKIPIFALEEIIALCKSCDSNKQNIFFRLGYFAHHKKYCFNPICAKQDNFEKSLERNDINPKYIFEFIYQNFKDLVETKKKDKRDEEGAEILKAKFLSFLMNFAQNPLLSFYEIQKTLSVKKKFSIYFSILSLSISHSVKSRMKIYLRKNEFDTLDLKKKNTYKEFFKTMETKKRLENNFKRVVINKINILEKTLVGFQSFKELFLCNLRLALRTRIFKKDLKGLNEIAPYQKVFKHKFSALLNSLIFNKLIEANLHEKQLVELFKSKSDELYNKTLLYDLIGEDTAVCEVSFVDQRGKILEKSKNAKFLRFFGYSSKDGPKISYAYAIMPEFIRKHHEKFVMSYIEQKNKFRPSNFLSFAIDKDDFAFPVNINIALKYHEENDFVLYGAFTKASGFHSKNFCLCDMEGEILDVSRDFFQDIAEEYDFLRVSDLKYLNIFQLMPDFSTYIKSLGSITKSKANCFKLYLPNEMRALIESRKKARMEKEISTSPNTKTGFNQKFSFLQDYKFTQNTYINFENERKFAEITFDLSPTQYGVGDSLLNFLILTITKFKKPEIMLENKEFSENINNTTLFNAMDSQINKLPHLVNLFVNEQGKKERFGTKLNTLQQSLKQAVKNFTIPQHLQEISEPEHISAAGEKQGKQDSLHISCTSSEYKSNITVFSALKILTKKYPKPLKISILLLIFQILFSFIFAMLYFALSSDYINGYFKPIQIGVREFSLQYHYNGDLMISDIRSEYFYLDLINITKRPEYGLFMSLIYNQSISNVKKINDRFRNKIMGLNFETFYRERLVSYYESYNFNLKKSQYIDFIDSILNNKINNLPLLITLNEKPIFDYNDFLFLIRNFPSYLSESAFIYGELMNEFATSDQGINTIFFNLLLMFILISLLIKIYEAFQWYYFMNLLQNILTSYLRIGEDELISEINTLNDFFELMNDSNEKYFNYNGTELVKKENTLSQQVSQNKTSKKRKRALYSQAKGLPKIFLFMYYFFCSSIIAFYFVFSYYSWISVDKYIVRLTNTNILFSSTYIYSSSVSFLEDLLYREKIIRNPEFEQLNVTQQTKEGRLQFFKAALDKRMNMIANTSAMNIVLDGIDDTKKLVLMSQLLRGDLCELLAKEYNFIDKQTFICENLLNGAFKKGLGTTISELFKSIKNRELTLQYKPKDSIDDKNQQEKIKEYIKSKDYFDMYLTEVFLHEILEKFYKINSEFYNDYLDKELLGFYTFLYISLSFMIIFNIFLVYFITKTIRLIYKSTCGIFFLIPYDRITKDEQMLIFLKRISK